MGFAEFFLVHLAEQPSLTIPSLYIFILFVPFKLQEYGVIAKKIKLGKIKIHSYDRTKVYLTLFISKSSAQNSIGVNKNKKRKHSLHHYYTYDIQ
jgi:hypothetical protein